MYDVIMNPDNFPGRDAQPGPYDSFGPPFAFSVSPVYGGKGFPGLPVIDTYRQPMDAFGNGFASRMPHPVGPPVYNPPMFAVRGNKGRPTVTVIPPMPQGQAWMFSRGLSDYVSFRNQDVAGQLAIYDLPTAKKEAADVYTGIQKGYDLTRYIPHVPDNAVLVFPRGLTPDEEMRLIQAAQSKHLRAVITSAGETPHKRSNTIMGTVDGAFANIDDAATLRQFLDLEGQQVRLSVTSGGYTLSSQGSSGSGGGLDEQRRQELIVLCQSKPWKEKCQQVGMYNPDARPSDEQPPSPPIFIGPPVQDPFLGPPVRVTPPVEWPTGGPPVQDPFSGPPVRISPPIVPVIPSGPRPGVVPLPPTYVPVETSADDDVTWQVLGYPDKATWKQMGKPRTPYTDVPRIGLPHMQPPVNGGGPANPLPPDYALNGPPVSGGGSSGSGATATVVPPSSSSAAPSDPNLIFGFPKQQVFIGVAVIAGLMLFKK